MAKRASPSTAKSPLERLDELLPLVEPLGVEVHMHASLLEVDNPAQLLELAADPGIRPHLLCRLSPTVALVDEGAADRLLEVLRKRGHTPKVLK